MNDILNFYHQQAISTCSSLPYIAGLQKAALADFARLEFPNRHHENWKYTKLDNFLLQRFVKPDSHTPSARLSHALDTPVAQVILDNGLILNQTALSNGILIVPLADALINHADKITPYLGHILRHEHGFQALNTAMLETGLFIYVPEGVCEPMPILLSHWQNKMQQAVYTRHVVIAEKGSSISIIEDFHGENGCSYLTNTITEIHVAPCAQVTHYTIQRESKQAFHIGHIAVQQMADSHFANHSISVGGKLVRSDIKIALHESKASCLMNGLYMPDNEQHVDHHTLVTHEVPDCLSEQDYKGILKGHSRAVFNGRVVVEKDAVQTVAKQQNKNLLLSAEAEIDTKPQLEIFADDVICTHGATVGQLDEDALFYLATRGIEREQASQYLIQAFIAENLQKIPNPALAAWASALLNQQLG